MCQKCLDKSKEKSAERRAWLKEYGLCPVCGSEKLFGNESRCPVCLAKAYESNLKHRMKNPHIIHDNYILRKNKLDEKGLCRQCGKRKKAEGHTYCEECLSKKRIRESKKRLEDSIPRSERYGYGLCYTCGKPLDTDKRLCKSCSERLSKNLVTKKPSINHPWKQDNQLLLRGIAK